MDWCLFRTKKSEFRLTVRAINPYRVVLSSGPNSVYEEGSFDIDPEIFNWSIPILGICYGMQYWLTSLEEKLFLPAMLVIVNTVNQHWLTESALLGTQMSNLSWWATVMLLQKFLLTLFVLLDCHMHLLKTLIRKFTVSIHPEVRHSVHGYDILRNFALNVCGAKGDWTMDNFIRCKSRQITWKSWS